MVVVVVVTGKALLPKGIGSNFLIDRKDINLENSPIAAGGFAQVGGACLPQFTVYAPGSLREATVGNCCRCGWQIFRGKYKGSVVALKEIHSHLVATPERCVVWGV